MPRALHAPLADAPCRSLGKRGEQIVYFFPCDIRVHQFWRLYPAPLVDWGDVLRASRCQSLSRVDPTQVLSSLENSKRFPISCHFQMIEL